MSETSLRVANFSKLFSMFAVVGSLLYMYAYATDKVDFFGSSDEWYSRWSKVEIFYIGLTVFAVFNILAGLAISAFKNVKGIDENSLFFRSEHHKEKLLVLLTYLLSGINVFIASVVFYLALVKINQQQDHMEYMYLPAICLVILISILITFIHRLLMARG